MLRSWLRPTRQDDAEPPAKQPRTATRPAGDAGKRAKPRPRGPAHGGVLDPRQRRIDEAAPVPTGTAGIWRGEFQALSDDPGAELCWGALCQEETSWRAQWRPLNALLADREVIPERRLAWVELWGETSEARHPLGVLAPFLWNQAALPRVLRPGHRAWVVPLARRLHRATSRRPLSSAGEGDDLVERALVPAVRRVVHWLSGLRHLPTQVLVQGLALGPLIPQE